VIDIGCEHSVEFAREELEPLVPLQSRPGGSGPYAATGERQAALLDAVRRTSNRPPRSPLPAQPPTGDALSLRASQPHAFPPVRTPSPPAPASAVHDHVAAPRQARRPTPDGQPSFAQAQAAPTQPRRPLPEGPPPLSQAQASSPHAQPPGTLQHAPPAAG